MSEAEVDLAKLFLDWSGLSAEEAYAEGETIFHEDLISRNGRSGVITAHDGEEVKIFADRFFHAFRTSTDRARRPFAKDKIAIDRLERIRWIRPMIEGKVSRSECWEIALRVPEEGKRPFPGKRFYVSWSLQYLIWLEPLRNGGFKFSSAYVAPRAEIADYVNRARKLWPL